MPFVILIFLLALAFLAFVLDAWLLSIAVPAVLTDPTNLVAWLGILFVVYTIANFKTSISRK